MIRDIDKKYKMSPSRKAKEIFYYDIETITEYALETWGVDMTEDEYAAVQDQLNKIHNRILKMINFK